MEFVPTDTDYGVALYIPRAVAGVVDNDIAKIARWAALADFDPSIEQQVSYEEEWLVTEVVDLYWKRSAATDPAIPSEYRAQHGNVGAVARMVVENGLEWLEQRARELAGTGIPEPQYRVVGDVVIVEGPDAPGLGWKLAAKAMRLSGAKVAVAKTTSPRGTAVIVAAYWRWMAKLPQLVSIVDQAVQEVAAGRSVVGNPGARSILARTAHLINERYVAQAVAEDFKAILERLAEMQKQQLEMYREYL